MAKDIELNIKVDTSALKELKSSYKAAMSAAVDGSEEAIQKAGELKDKINDLNENVKEFAAGSKMEVFGNVLGGLGGKLKDLDFKGAAEKAQSLANVAKGMTFKEALGGVKDLSSAFINMGKALLLNPIFLIATIIILVGAALYALKDKVKFIGDAFAFFGKIIDVVIQGIKDFLDWIGLTNFAVEDNATKTINAAKSIQDATTQRYDDEIALANAAGENTAQREIDKQKSIAETARVQIAALKTILQANGVLDDEQKKQLAEFEKTLHDSELSIQVNTIKENKRTADELEKINKETADKKVAADKKAYDSWKKTEEKKAADALKLAQEADKARVKLRDDQEKTNDQLAADAQTALDEEELRLETDAIKKLEILRLRELAKLELTKQTAIDANDAVLKIDNAAQDNKTAIELNYQSIQDAINLKYETETAEKKKTNAVNTAKTLADIEKEKDEKLLLNDDLKNKERKALKKKYLDDTIAVLKAQKDIELSDLNLTAEQKLLIEEKYQTDVAKLKDDAAAKDKQRQKDVVADIIKGVNSLASSVQTVLSSVSDYQATIANEQIKAIQQQTSGALTYLDAQKQEELALAEKTGANKDKINAKYAQKEYEIKLSEYNRETAIKKKAFETDKKFRIAQTVISTITGAIAAVTGMIQAIPGPVGIILGVVAGLAVTAAGVLQIAKIRATTFDAGTAPTAPAAPGAGALLSGGPDGEQNKLQKIGSENQKPAPVPIVKAVVVSQDVTKQQGADSVLERRAAFA